MKAVKIVVFILGVSLIACVSGTNERILEKELADQFSQAVKSGKNNQKFHEWATNRIHVDVLELLPQCTELESKATTAAQKRNVLQSWSNTITYEYEYSVNLALLPRELSEAIQVALRKLETGDGKASAEIKKIVDSMRTYIDREFFYQFLAYVKTARPRDSPERKALDALFQLFYKKSESGKTTIIDSRLQEKMEKKQNQNSQRPIQITLGHEIDEKVIEVLAEEFSFEGNEHIITPRQ